MALAGGGSEDEGRVFGSGGATILSENAISASGSWTYTETDSSTGETFSCSGSSEFTLTR